MCCGFRAPAPSAPTKGGSWRPRSRCLGSWRGEMGGAAQTRGLSLAAEICSLVCATPFSHPQPRSLPLQEGAAPPGWRSAARRELGRREPQAEGGTDHLRSRLTHRFSNLFISARILSSE